MKRGAFRGATAWEAFLGPIWVTLAFPRYWRYAWPLRVGWDAGPF